MFVKASMSVIISPKHQLALSLKYLINNWQKKIQTHWRFSYRTY